MHIRDVLPQISSYIRIYDQPQFRRVSRMFYDTDITKDVCCLEPSTFEIINWIWDQSILLQYEQTHSAALFSPLTSETYSGVNASVNFQFVSDVTRIDSEYISLDVENGKILRKKSFYDTIGERITNKDYLMHLLTGKHLKIEYYNRMHFPMIRDIFSLRVPCILHGISSDECYIKFLSKVFSKTLTLNANNWPYTVKNFYRYITESAQQRLKDSIYLTFGQNVEDLFYIIPINPDVFEPWFESWIQTLKSSDLAPNPQISYLATAYS